jgi:hypothetical protein
MVRKLVSAGKKSAAHMNREYWDKAIAFFLEHIIELNQQERMKNLQHLEAKSDYRERKDAAIEIIANLDMDYKQQHIFFRDLANSLYERKDGIELMPTVIHELSKSYGGLENSHPYGFLFNTMKASYRLNSFLVRTKNAHSMASANKKHAHYANFLGNLILNIDAKIDELFPVAAEAAQMIVSPYTPSLSGLESKSNPTNVIKLGDKQLDLLRVNAIPEDSPSIYMVRNITYFMSAIVLSESSYVQEGILPLESYQRNAGAVLDKLSNPWEVALALKEVEYAVRQSSEHFMPAAWADIPPYFPIRYNNWDGGITASQRIEDFSQIAAEFVECIESKEGFVKLYTDTPEYKRAYTLSKSGAIPGSDPIQEKINLHLMRV